MKQVPTSVLSDIKHDIYFFILFNLYILSFILSYEYFEIYETQKNLFFKQFCRVLFAVKLNSICTTRIIMNRFEIIVYNCSFNLVQYICKIYLQTVDPRWLVNVDDPCFSWPYRILRAPKTYFIPVSKSKFTTFLSPICKAYLRLFR